MITPKRDLDHDEETNIYSKIDKIFDPENDKSMSINSPRMVKQLLDCSLGIELSSFEQSYLYVTNTDNSRRIDLPD